MISELRAEEPAAKAPQPANLGDMLLPLGLMFIVFYFLLIRPNQKKMKKREEFLRSMNKGDEVITSGGILGKITGMTDLYVTLDTGETKVKVLKSHVSCSTKDIQTTENKPKEKE